MTHTRLNIALVEPFYSGSHKKWADAYQTHSQHNVQLYTLPGRHWKWRMRGGAVELAQQHFQQMDALLVTDMLDVATFCALAALPKSLPIVLYMHENQLTYPWSPTDADKSEKRDFHYAYINYTSCLMADQIWFNSHYHQSAFLAALKVFLSRFPDFKNLQHLTQIEQRSSVVPIGMEFPEIPSTKKVHSPPILLWNHRWEFDKNPALFFQTLFELKAEKIPFQLIVLGEHTHKYPAIFDEAQKKLANEIVHWGYANSVATYQSLIQQADIVPVTSNQDFFGISTVEALYAGCYPILPNRLAFPEHLPLHFSAHYYETDNQFKDLLRTALRSNTTNYSIQAVRTFLANYNWNQIAPLMDNKLKTVIDGNKEQNN